MDNQRRYEITNFATRFRKLKFMFTSKFSDLQVLRFRNWLKVSELSLGWLLLPPVIAVKIPQTHPGTSLRAKREGVGRGV